MEGIPAEQLKMQGGELVGLKLVGVYLAPDTEAGRKWQRDNLSADFTARFSVLERVDQLRDDDKNHDVRQLRYSMMRCRSSTPFYWMRTMYPCVVRPVLEEVVEPALKKSFVQLAEAGHSPQELIDQAWAEAQQDGRFGGCGLGGTHKRRMRALRQLSSRSTRHYVTPSHCGACPSPRWQGKRQCRCCSTLRSTTMTSANGVAMSRASTRCVHKTRSLASATRTSLAASVRPCCRRRGASRLHAAEHLSSPETGHARCWSGPMKK